MKRIILIAFITSACMLSCDDFLDVNKNPNQATTATPELVLTAALNNTAAQNFYNQMGAMWAGQWCPSGDVSGFIQEKTYDLSNTYGTGIWTGMYDILADYKYVIDQATESEKIGTAAIGRIMSVYIYHKLVDTYNNVPYSEALQGTTVINPKYDDAQTVYEALADELDDAVADLQAIDPIADIPPGAADIVFAGDYTKWMQFANTLKLRLLIRQTEMSGRSAYITAELAQITANGEGYLTENANSTPGYLQSAGKQNPFWDTYYRTEAGALRSTFNFLRSTEFLLSNLPTTDIRRLYIIAGDGVNTHPINSDGKAVTGTTPNFAWSFAGARDGVDYGDETPAAYSNVTSGIGFGILKSFNMPVTIFTASESYFLQCEAVQRGLLAGDAEVLYETAITESFKLLGAKTESVDKISGAITVTKTAVQNATDRILEVPYDGTLSRIITQKWLASVGYAGFEAWCDHRRTGFPNAPLSLKAIKSNPPLRLFYPNQELQTNSASVEAQGEIDVWNDGIFWNQN